MSNTGRAAGGGDTTVIPGHVGGPGRLGGRGSGRREVEVGISANVYQGPGTTRMLPG